MTVVELLGLAAQWGPSAGATILILWAGYRRIWVWGRELDKAEKRADKFETMALRSLHIADVATKAVEQTKGGQG